MAPCADDPHHTVCHDSTTSAADRFVLAIIGADRLELACGAGADAAGKVGL